MNTTSRRAILGTAILLALGAAGYGGWQLGRHAGTAAQTAADPASGRRVLYWHDPMVPGQKFDKPGKSPFMDMPLVPVYADQADDAGAVAVSARQTQSLGLRTASVTRGELAPSVEAGGVIAWNERGLSVVQARNAGFVERLFVRATLDRVAKGQALAELYVPDWVAVQEEFLAVRAMKAADSATLIDAARARMRQAGMPEALIARVEREGKVQARVRIEAPEAGSIVELALREGMTVAPGSTLFRINRLDSVWLEAELPEAQAALARPGAPVEARAAGFPGERFRGRVQAVLPQVDATTRTLRLRIELANPGGRLAPGMYASVGIGNPPRSALLIPQEALIRTGRRTLVMLAENEGRYRPVEVEAGAESGEMVEIRRGLSEGQQIVVSGQFLLDSEASLRAAGTRLAQTPPRASAKAQEYEVEAVFESVVDDLAMISHPPIPALQWGAMTMGFKLPREGVPKDLAPGQKVHIVFTVPAGGEPQLLHLMPSGGGK